MQLGTRTKITLSHVTIFSLISTLISNLLKIQVHVTKTCKIYSLRGDLVLQLLIQRNI
jgi:hypothetical protein